MTYMTYAVGRMIVEMGLSDAGVTVLEQHAMSDEEQALAARYGHRFDLCWTPIERSNTHPLTGAINGRV